MSRLADTDSLEIVMRIRHSRGWVAVEYTVRRDRVEVRNYYPSGEIILNECGSMSLDQFKHRGPAHRRTQAVGTSFREPE